MSWLTKIKDSFIITCGDGKQYTPNWLNAAKKVEYNTTVFEFIEVKGSKVDRREAKGNQYTLEIFFQGENHLEIASAFESSAEDKRFWTIKHPFYGQIFVQPTSLSFDNRDYNVSKITGTVIETITETNPKTVVGAEDRIAETTENVSALSIEEVVNSTSKPDITDINQQRTETTSFYNKVKNFILDNQNGADYFNKFNSANAAIGEEIEKPGSSLDLVQELILAPATFEQSLASKLEGTISGFNQLDSSTRFSFDDASSRAKNIKRTYQSFGSALISCLCLSTANPIDGDYESRVEISDYIAKISNTYNQFILTLDFLQEGSGGNPDDFVANSKVINALNDLVNFTISNLFSIGFEAKQERVYVTEYETNIILLAHRFYGPSSDDSHIDALMEQNGIGLNEILVIPKDKKMLYYI